MKQSDMFVDVLEQTKCEYKDYTEYKKLDELMELVEAFSYKEMTSIRAPSFDYPLTIHRIIYL